MSTVARRSRLELSTCDVGRRRQALAATPPPLLRKVTAPGASMNHAEKQAQQWGAAWTEIVTLLTCPLWCAAAQQAYSIQVKCNHSHSHCSILLRCAPCLLVDHLRVPVDTCRARCPLHTDWAQDLPDKLTDVTSDLCGTWCQVHQAVRLLSSRPRPSVCTCHMPGLSAATGAAI